VAFAYGLSRTERAAMGGGLSAQVAAVEKRRQATAPIPYAKKRSHKLPLPAAFAADLQQEKSTSQGNRLSAEQHLKDV